MLTIVPSRRLLVLAISACLFAPRSHIVAQEPFVVDEMVVVLIDQVNVPASKSGVIAEMNVREGESVVAGQVLAKLDDREASLRHAAAITERSIAEEKTVHRPLITIAKKKLQQQRQLASQHEITVKAAQAKSKNEVRIQASKKAESVAHNEWKRAVDARDRFIDSVSSSEIESLRLAYERTVLETRQAVFEHEMDGLLHQTQQAVAVGHTLAIEQAVIELGQAIADQQVQQLEVEWSQQQAELAALSLSQHRIAAPWDGVVVQRIRNRGDWVTSGDPVVRLIRLNRLRAEGFVSAELVGLLRVDQNVQLIISTSAGSKTSRQGTVVFISPEIDPVNNEIRFLVEFENPELDVLPGMRLSLHSRP